MITGRAALVTVRDWEFEGTELGDTHVVIDTSVAHPARAYDYWLGGRTHFQVDRDLAEAIMAAVPTMRSMARANRAFLRRAVTHLAGEAGVTQFLDIGTGIPGPDNVHEVAQAIAPHARVQYVDNDPIVLAHAHALLDGSRYGDTSIILADLREPGTVLDRLATTGTLDLDRPVALLMVAVLMFIRDDEDPGAMVRTLLDALPVGSFLAVSHPTADFNAEEMAAAVAAATHAGVTLVPRGKAAVEAFFDGLEMVEPGVAPVLAWRPEETVADPHAAYYYAGVGRKV